MSATPRTTVALIRYLFGDAPWSRLTFGVVAVFLARAALVAAPLAFAAVLELFAEEPAGADLATAATVLIAAHVGLSLASSLLEEVRELVILPIKQRMSRELNGLALEMLHVKSTKLADDKREIGVLSRSINRASWSLGTLFDIALFTIIPTFVEIALSVVVVSYLLGWVFALGLVATVVAFLAWTLRVTPRQKQLYARRLEADSHLGGLVVDSLLNRELVLDFDAVESERRRLAKAHLELEEHWQRQQRDLSLQKTIQALIVHAGQAALLVVGLRFYLQGTLELADLVLIQLYVARVCVPLRSSGVLYAAVNQAWQDVRFLLPLVDAPIDESRPLTVKLGPARRAPAYEIEGLAVRGRDSRLLLDHVSFRIPSGALVAIVGRSGSGKSTLARVLTGLLTPDSGSVASDGRVLDANRLNQLSVYVPQRPTFLNATLAENLRVGASGATDDELRSCLETACLESLASSPAGLDLRIGELGDRLSGGERQRLAVARALLAKPPLLVLDEFTAELDYATELRLVQNLGALRSGCTTVIIAHRLATVRGADLILVVDEGRIVASGSHEELVQHGGLYAELWTANTKTAAAVREMSDR